MSSTQPKPRRVRVERGIYQRQDGTFEIGWRDAQKIQKWKTVSGGIKAARAALAEEHARRARGERVAADPRLTFDSAATVWWDARVVNLRPSTQSAYSGCLKHLREHFGRTRLTNITATDVAKYVQLKKGEGLKGSTIRGHLTALGSVFAYSARHLGFVGINPVTLLDRVERPSRDDARAHRVLTSDESRRLLAAVDPYYRLIFELAAETGGRLGEVLGLEWQHIDFEGDSIHFVQQLDRKGNRARLKTSRSRRWVEVTPGLTARLRELRVSSPASTDNDLVFVSRTGTALDHRNVAGRVMARAVTAAGLDDVMRGDEVIVRAPTFHDLRHSHASALIAQGWDVEEVSSRLGHADVAITQQTYVHAFDHAKRSSDRRRRLAELYPAEVEASVEASEHSSAQQDGTATGTNVRELRPSGT